MQVKVLEVRDIATFIPIVCVKPIPVNEEQKYLLQRDGYVGDASERCVIVIKAQCRGVSYDPYNWPGGSRTMPSAHLYIEQHWDELKDGDVVDVQHILGETPEPKKSERFTDV